MTDARRPEIFSMTSDPEHLALMRSWLREELARYDLSPQDQSALLVAVGELCTNSIRHAYEGVGGHPIRVSIQAFEDRLVIEVEDFGKPFDAGRYVEPDFDAAPEHGMGLYLVRKIADLVSLNVGQERGTHWTLVKYRPGRRPGPDASPGTARGPV